MRMENNSNSHVVGFDVIKIVGIIGVVILHAVSYVVRSQEAAGIDFVLAQFLNMFFRWGVPVFFMISGALVLRKDRGTDYVVSRIKRLGLPFLFWNIFFVSWNLFRGESFIIQLTELVTHGYSSYHLYFLTALVEISLFIPLLTLLIRTSSRLSAWITLLWMVLASYSAFVHEWYWWHIPYTYWSGGMLWVPFIGYFMLGSLLTNKNIMPAWISRFEKLSTGTLLVALMCLTGMLSLLFHYLFSLYGLDSRGIILESYVFFPITLQSMIVFWLSKRIVLNQRFYIKITQHLSGYVFGIYLVHTIILAELMTFLSRYGVKTHQLGTALVAALITLVISYVIVWLMKFGPLRTVVS